MHIWMKDTIDKTKIYRIGSTELRQEYFTNSGSDEILLNSGIPTACPESCAFKLSTNIRSSDGPILLLSSSFSHSNFSESNEHDILQVFKSKNKKQKIFCQSFNIILKMIWLLSNIENCWNLQISLILTKGSK